MSHRPSCPPRIVTSCDSRQPASCSDPFCEVCVFRGWDPSAPFAEETDLDDLSDDTVSEGGFIKGDNLDLDPIGAAEPPRAKRFCGGRDRDMPCQPLDDEEERDLAAMEEVENSSAPRTPKRDAPTREGEAQATPAKTRRGHDPEPTNNDLLVYMKSMFESNTAQLKKLEGRFDHHERRLSDVEEGYKQMASRLNESDRAEKNKIDELSKQMQSNMREVTKRLNDLAKKQEQVSTAASSATAAPQNPNDFIVIVNGFKRETPRGQLHKLFDRFVKPKVAAALQEAEYEAPYLLSSCIHVRCGSACQQRDLLAALRSEKVVFTLDGVEYNIFGTTQKSRHQRDRNRRLMRIASYIQNCAHGGGETETYKMVCWRSACVVWADRRIVNLAQDLATLNFHDDKWHSTELYSQDIVSMKEEMRRIVADDVADSEAYNARRST